MNTSGQPTSVYEMILDTASGQEEQVVVAAPSQVHMSLDWQEHQEGQLAVDVAENKDELIVVSTMAGVDTEQIQVYVHNDLLTIRGVRVSPFAHESHLHFYCQECFWGKFSRTIVLPVHVKGDLARAEYKHGLLTVRIPKLQSHSQIHVKIVEE